MIKDLTALQKNSKHAYFAQKLTTCLQNKNIQATPTVLATAFNKHFKTTVAKPHTARKWLLGQTQPKSETLLLLAKWLKVDPKDLISQPSEDQGISNKICFEFDFTDQEVISKYLAMTVKEKVTVRLVIDAITGKQT